MGERAECGGRAELRRRDLCGTSLCLDNLVRDRSDALGCGLGRRHAKAATPCGSHTSSRSRGGALRRQRPRTGQLHKQRVDEAWAASAEGLLSRPG